MPEEAPPPPPPASSPPPMTDEELPKGGDEEDGATAKKAKKKKKKHKKEKRHEQYLETIDETNINGEHQQGRDSVMRSFPLSDNRAQCQYVISSPFLAVFNSPSTLYM